MLITFKTQAMPYFIITVQETKAGARRRRKLVVTSRTKPEAMISFQDMCRGTGFLPDYRSVNEITPLRYSKIVATLLGRKMNMPQA